MNYIDVDPTINAWAQRHKLTVYRQHQDVEVRSVDVVDLKGRKFQIWIDSAADSKFVVHAWDYRHRKHDWTTTRDQLDKDLEHALFTVKGWMTN
jgi:hypothetical protein